MVACNLQKKAPFCVYVCVDFAGDIFLSSYHVYVYYFVIKKVSNVSLLFKVCIFLITVYIFQNVIMSRILQKIVTKIWDTPTQ